MRAVLVIELPGLMLPEEFAAALDAIRGRLPAGARVTAAVEATAEAVLAALPPPPETAAEPRRPLPQPEPPAGPGTPPHHAGGRRDGGL